MSAAQAYVLIQTDVGRSAQVAEEVAAIGGVIAAHNVTGNYDVIVLIEAPSMDDLGRLVVNKIQLVHGITRTATCSVVHL
jgi:DNA-binding Lrp family transcriptional regulator